MAEADWRPFWGELGSNPQALRTISTHDQHDGVDIQSSELISPQTPVRCAPEHRANLPKHTGCSTILSHTDTDTYTDTQHGYWREKIFTHFETYLNSPNTEAKPRYENKKICIQVTLGRLYFMFWHAVYSIHFALENQKACKLTSTFNQPTSCPDLHPKISNVKSYMEWVLL